MEEELKRLADAAESLERQAAELRDEVDALAAAVRDGAAAGRAEPEDAREDTKIPDGARLVALSMALDGASREDTALHLQQEFALDDVERLLDDVYARAGS